MGVNRLITRGMGRNYQQPGNSGMITTGLGGFFEQIIDDYIVPVSRLVVRAGRSARDYVKTNVNKTIVWARLMFVNDIEPDHIISGSTSEYSIMQRGGEATLVSNKINTKSDVSVTVSRV